MKARASSSNPRICSSIPKFLAISFLGGIATFGTALANEPVTKNALATEANPTSDVTDVCYRLNEKAFSQLIHATCYSELNKAVVVLVSGNAEGMSGKQVAEHITSKFEENYVPAVGFLRNAEWDGVALSYFLNGTGYGPYSGENWKEGFEKLKKHSAQAWYQTPNR